MLAGYSLGGNFALRVGLNAPAVGVELHAVLAVSPVLDPRRTLAALESGWPIYRYYFMRKWRRSLLRKAELFPDVYDFSDIRKLESLTAMTAFFVERYTGYPSLEEYFLGYALIGDRLRGLSVPSLLIAAEDDPIIPAADLDSLDRGSALRVLRSRHGGHCGFFDGWRLSSWVEDRAVDLFDSRKAALAGQGGNA
jgi:predicted alpha/beta-fold hydrolase